MAWNEPGGGKDKDPWSGRGDQQGPPDLEEIVRNIQGKFGGLFGGRRGGSNDGGASSGGPGKLGAGGLVFIGVIIIAVWIASGFYIVDEGTRGVVLRFGEYSESTQPGLRWHIPTPVEMKEIVDVENRRFVEVGYRSSARSGTAQTVPREALMLTEDENIVDIRIAIQYQVKSPQDYLFNVRDPDTTLRQAAESAIREMIGKSKMDFVLKEGRAEVAAGTLELMQRILDQYKAGLQVVNVNLQDAQPPEEVQGAFADAIKAREDEQRFKNEAEAYANDVLPKARGAAARVLQEADAYKEQVIAEAEGEANRFLKLLAEYEKAPGVTGERLYIEAMESVLGNSSKVMVDIKNGNNLLYLPLDQLMQSAGAVNRPSQRRTLNTLDDDNSDSVVSPDNVRDAGRSRRAR
jgi:membrane protease subunit HflK